MNFIIRLIARATFVAACAFPVTALGTDFTDIWFNPQESGWGVNVVQADNFLFLTFFIYGANRQPTWYTAQLTWDGTRYSGGLYRTEGSFWPNTWNPAEHPAAVQVGNASFQPDANDAYHATLVWNDVSVGGQTKRVQRQTLTTIALGGSYRGGQSGAYSSCTQSSQNQGYTDTYRLNVTQAANGSAALTFVYDSGATCTLTGTLQQFGQLYDLANASYACTGTLTFTTTATVYELKATAQGLEGRLVANLPSGCREDADFSGVLLR